MAESFNFVLSALLLNLLSRHVRFFQGVEQPLNCVIGTREMVQEQARYEQCPTILRTEGSQTAWTVQALPEDERETTRRRTNRQPSIFPIRTQLRRR